MIKRQPEHPSAAPSKWDEAVAGFIYASRGAYMATLTLSTAQRLLANAERVLGGMELKTLTLADAAKG